MHAVELQAETLRRIFYVLGAVAMNVAVSGLTWRIVGAKGRGARLVGRISGAVFCIANLGLVMVCFLYLLRNGWDWFYVVLFVIAVVFAIRVGGATVGRYP